MATYPSSALNGMAPAQSEKSIMTAGKAISNIESRKFLK